ncbi:apolipoprotein D-like [Centroberyx gerrardi]|uniref:apolipoprotein D-like n=1 Tax=Centroberyx gerrardi TaxID=166262 RepID=UPI003AACDE1E
MTAFQVLSVLLLAAAAAHAQSFHLGSCPTASVEKDFNITEYMGTWYEIEKLPAVFERGKCVQATYSLLSDGTVSVRNAELLSNGKINSIEGVARVKDPSQPAILAVSFFKGIEDPYWVLSTDYRSYALVYSCSNYLGLFHIDFAWILARTRALTDDIISQQRDKLAAAGVDINRLTVSNQTGCDAMA